MDLTSWIIDYTTYLHANGYKRHNIDVRINHLHCLNRFIEAKGLVSIEQFPQEWGERLYRLLDVMSSGCQQQVRIQIQIEI